MSWTATEFKSINLGGPRRNPRAIHLIERLSANPTADLPKPAATGPTAPTAQTNKSKSSTSANSSQIHEPGYRNTPLSEEQQISNKAKSSVRARVEHVFDHMGNSMGGIFLRTIGAARAKVGAGLRNLSYNLVRVDILIRTKVFSFARVSAPKIQVAA